MKVVSSAAVNWVFKRKCMKKIQKLKRSKHADVMHCLGRWSVQSKLHYCFLTNIFHCTFEQSLEADKLWNVWTAASCTPSHSLHFHRGILLSVKFEGNLWDFFSNLCFDDFDWNFEDSNPILRWDDPILVLIIFTGSFAGWPLSEHHINWRKLKTKRHGRARSWWWTILSAVRHHLYLLQTKILFALRRQIPYFAKDKQTSTARNVTA